MVDGQNLRSREPSKHMADGLPWRPSRCASNRIRKQVSHKQPFPQATVFASDFSTLARACLLTSSAPKVNATPVERRYRDSYLLDR